MRHRDGLPEFVGSVSHLSGTGSFTICYTSHSYTLLEVQVNGAIAESGNDEAVDKDATKVGAPA